LKYSAVAARHIQVSLEAVLGIENSSAGVPDSHGILIHRKDGEARFKFSRGEDFVGQAMSFRAALPMAPKPTMATSNWLFIDGRSYCKPSGEKNKTHSDYRYFFPTCLTLH
jgi:hypothetical protein